jgi:ankyrin repeat protein
MSALVLATYNGFTGIVQLLLQNKADTTAKDKAGKTAEEYAIEKGHGEIAALLQSN